MAIKDVVANDDASLPLITSPYAAAGDRTSAIQTLGNIIVSIVGTGVLGLPYAFRVAGWFAGSLGVIIVGFATYYCMLLLVSSLLHFINLTRNEISFGLNGRHRRLKKQSDSKKPESDQNCYLIKKKQMVFKG